jgi:hypothetical protein
MIHGVRYAVTTLAVIAVAAAGAAYGPPESSRTAVPAIQLLSDAVSEREASEPPRASRERKREGAAKPRAPQRGAAPVRIQPAAPAGDDDDDGDEGD